MTADNGVGRRTSGDALDGSPFVCDRRSEVKRIVARLADKMDLNRVLRELEAVEPDVFKHASRAGKVVAETDKMICAGCGDCFVGVHWLDQDGKTQCPGCYFARFDNRDKG